MPADWTGYYLDGKTAARQSVSIRLIAAGIELQTQAGRRIVWPYPEIRIAREIHSHEEVRLERGGPLPETLVVGDPGLLAELRVLAPKFAEPAGPRRAARPVLLALAAPAAIGMGALLFFWGIPALASVLAQIVPTSWEEELGKSTVEELVPARRQCVDPSRTRIVEELVSTLARARPAAPYTFRVSVINDTTANAFAAPGGYMVVSSALIRLTQRAEELAAVLAHEMQHVLQRHTTRGLIQQLSTGLFFSALVGEGGRGAEAAQTLVALRYSRDQEAEADAQALRLLVDAGVDPQGMILALDRLRAEAGPEPPPYLSSHPAPDDRIAKLRALLSQGPRTETRLLPNYDWVDMQQICRAAETTARPG